MDRGMPVNQQTSEGKSALMLAASNGHLDAVNLLLKRGADLTLSDNYGTTAIIISATAGNAEVVKALLAQGGDPVTKDSSGGSALDNATFYGQADSVNAILSTKPKLAPEHATELLLLASGLGRLEIVSALLKYGVDPNVSGKKQRTPLIAAAAFNQVEAARILLINGARLSLQDKQGHTALDIAKDKGHDEMIAFLQKPDAQ